MVILIRQVALFLFMSASAVSPCLAKAEEITCPFPGHSLLSVSMYSSDGFQLTLTGAPAEMQLLDGMVLCANDSGLVVSKDVEGECALTGKGGTIYQDARELGYLSDGPICLYGSEPGVFHADDCKAICE